MFTRSNILFSLLALGLTLAMGSRVFAQQSPLSPIPAKCPLLIHLHGWDRSMDRMKATVKSGLPDFAPMITSGIENSLTGLLQGRELKGLAKDGPVFVVFTELPNPENEVPEFAVVARVTNYVQFRDNLLKDEEKSELKAEKDGVESTKVNGTKVYFLSRDDFAIFSPSEKAIKVLVDKKTESMAGKLDKAAEREVLDPDFSLLLDVRAVRKMYGDKINDAKAFLDQALQQAQNFGGIEKEQLEAVKKLFEGAFQMVDDADSLLVSADFRPEGLMLHFHSHFGEKTKVNDFLKTIQAAPLAGVDKLPIGQLSYTGSTGNFSLLQGAGNTFLGLGGGSSDSKENKAYQEAVEALAKLKAESTSSSSDYPAAGLQVTEYSDPAKAVYLTLKMFEAMPENAAFAGVAIKGKPKIQKDAKKVGDLSLHSVEVTLDLDKMVERFPEEIRDAMKESFKKLVGSEMRFWVGNSGKVFIQLTGKDWESANKMLDTYLSGNKVIGKEEGFNETRKQLPKDASMLTMIDAGRAGYFIAQYGGEVLRNVPGFPGQLLAEPKLPEGKPVYFGIAVTLKPQHGSLDIWLPAAGVNAIIKVLAPLFNGLGGE
ncbi:MAG TPA: hypothetical protein VGZ47_10155 [Gemmataceae bacterium]|jgi:hypothetical protein|nr:hypothetical protein [Gemmataceae bacterium]